VAEEIYDLVTGLRDAIQGAFVATADPPARYTVQPGDLQSYSQDLGTNTDACCDGQVIVLAGSLIIPDLASLRAGGPMYQPVAVVVLRCAATVNSVGRPPNDAAMLADFERYADDAKVVRAAVRAFLSGPDVDLNETDLTDYAEDTVGPQGGCGGKAISFVIPIMEDCS
jgi:hypothetical protein